MGHLEATLMHTTNDHFKTLFRAICGFTGSKTPKIRPKRAKKSAKIPKFSYKIGTQCPRDHSPQTALLFGGRPSCPSLCPSKTSLPSRPFFLPFLCHLNALRKKGTSSQCPSKCPSQTKLSTKLLLTSQIFSPAAGIFWIHLQ